MVSMDTKTLFDMWNTRPVRQRSGKSIAGVCTGIGRRYNVDPTLVKVAFVVAAMFGGSGIFLYLACLIAMPGQHAVAPRALTPDSHGLRGMHEIPWYWIAAAVVCVVALGNMGSSSPFWGSSGLLGVALMLGGWWLLYMRTPQAPAGTSADQLGARGAIETIHPPVNSEYPPVAVPSVGLSKAADLSKPVPPTGDAPPAWDPLGTARFAWDLPEPTPPPTPPAPKPPRSRLTSIFAGLAVIVATVSTAANVVGGVEWFTVGRIAALALAVLGVGMLIDSVQRRRAGTRAAGLVPLAMMVGVVAVIATLFAGGRADLPAGGVGDRTWTPRTSEQLGSEYQLSVGTSTLDLRNLAGLDRDRTVVVRQGIGDVTVLLPDDIRVKTECRIAIGDQVCPESTVNPDAKTPTLTVKAELSIGNVEMKK